jgi:hypothetical protein
MKIDTKKKTERQTDLARLVSVGPATLQDLELLGIRSVAELARSEPTALYRRLCERTGVRHDPCCLDVFTAAVAQARNPMLPPEQRVWWYWSRVRKSSSPAHPARSARSAHPARAANGSGRPS